MLYGLQFPDSFIQRIMECVTTPKFSIMINGNPCGFFSSRRGLRQGDPMSPYLFVLAMDYLSRMLKELPSMSLFRYHPKCKSIKLVQLCFADDITAFCKGDVNSPLILKEYFEKFSNTSGLRVNKDKSHVFFCGVDDQVKQYLLEQLGHSKGQLPVKYLGLPLIATKLTELDCSPILDKMKRKISSWSAKSLTYAGRILLIKAILLHYQVFWSNLVMLPKSIVQQIDSICRNYLWGRYNR